MPDVRLVLGFGDRCGSKKMSVLPATIEHMFD